MIPNLYNYKIINILSSDILGFQLKTTYTNPQSSIFNFNFLEYNFIIQQYPIVYKINHNCEAYKKGLQVGHKIIKINDVSLEYKDVETLLSDFIYEKKQCDYIKLTIL